MFETANVINALVQIYMLHLLTDRHFLEFGYIYFTDKNTIEDLFPKISKCKFNRHGPGGDINVGFQMNSLNINIKKNLF